MSGTGPNATASGLFETYTSAYTKSFKGESSRSPTADNYARLWWGIGWGGSKNWIITVERSPVPSSARNLYSSITLQDNRWYCIETHEQMNTPDVANGIVEAWVDGVKVLSVSDVKWRNTGTDSEALWREFAVIRQGGAGNIWYDRFAAGTTRIGCLGAGTSDITPPTPPQGLVIR